MEFSAETVAVDVNGKPIIAVVVIDDIGVMARYEAGEWVPQYGIRQHPLKTESDRIEIPPCFFFNPLAAILLDSLREDGGPAPVIIVEAMEYELPG